MYFIWRFCFLYYRIQNTETHVHKITNVHVFFIWRLDLIILMRANPLLGPLEGVGPCNSSGLHQNHYVPHHIKNRYINSY
jgi:hypothetical protein